MYCPVYIEEQQLEECWLQPAAVFTADVVDRVIFGARTLRNVKLWR